MCQVGQLRVELVKLYINYAKRAKQSLLESYPANIFPIKTNFIGFIIELERISIDLKKVEAIV